MVEVEAWKNIVKTGNLIVFLLWLMFFILNGAKLVLKYNKKSDFIFYFICKLLLIITIVFHIMTTLRLNRDFIGSMMFSWFTTISLFFVSTFICILRTKEIEDKKERAKLYLIFGFDIAFVCFLFTQVILVFFLCIDVDSSTSMDDIIKNPEQLNGLMRYLKSKNEYVSPDNNNTKFIDPNRFDGEGIHYIGKMFSV